MWSVQSGCGQHGVKSSLLHDIDRGAVRKSASSSTLCTLSTPWLLHPDGEIEASAIVAFAATTTANATTVFALPDLVLVNILAHLEASGIAHSALVCRGWAAAIQTSTELQRAIWVARLLPGPAGRRRRQLEPALVLFFNQQGGAEDFVSSILAKARASKGGPRDIENLGRFLRQKYPTGPVHIYPRMPRPAVQFCCVQQQGSCS